MDMDNIYLKITPFIEDNGLKISQKGKASTYGQMVGFIKDNGNKEK